MVTRLLRARRGDVSGPQRSHASTPSVDRDASGSGHRTDRGLYKKFKGKTKLTVSWHTPNRVNIK